MNKIKVLVVDDNKDILYSVKRSLENLDKGYGIFFAQSGEDCFKVLLKERIDIILLDLMMPGMDGWEVFAKLKADSKLKDVPVIFLTALTQKTYKETERLKGMNPCKIDKINYIMKPFNPEDLDNKIRAFLKIK